MGTRVLLADDHVLVRQTLKGYLNQAGLEVVGEAGDGQEVVKLAQELYPEIAVVDVEMPVLNGVDACREILRVSPRTKTILLTMHRDDQYIIEALRAGVKGYVLKKQVAADLVQAIGEVALGRIYLSPQISTTVVDAFLGRRRYAPDPLTPRERQVLQLIAEGKTTKEAAVILGISPKTADSHRTRIMDKLDIHQTAGLVRYAIRRGLVQP